MSNQENIMVKLEEAVEEAKRFIRKAELVIDNDRLYGSAVASCKRASLDASKALSAYRNAMRDQWH